MNYFPTTMPALYPFPAYCLQPEDYMAKKALGSGGSTEATEMQIQQRKHILKW